MAGEMEPLRRRCLKTMRVTRRTVVLLEILRSQNIPAALQMLVEPVVIPKLLWIDMRASWSVVWRFNLDWTSRMRVNKWRNKWKMVAIAGGE
ncbi:hypothetical protein HanRHA438_Chr16g0735461 [Helianthus annuus]|nr:hypothetical protein HanRHA438_Chr16g0735461 [Helianthus annuus]